jgi:squalene-associated FAD-dependent desaturase
LPARAGAPDVVVAGAGFAGLAAATLLAERGARVLVCEARPHPGGRARSWTDPETGSVIDNGQHLFAGSYTETMRFLDRIGTRGSLRLQERLVVPIADPGGRIAAYGGGWGSGPLGALTALLRAPRLSGADRLRLLRVALQARKPPMTLDRVTVHEWLLSLGQSQAALQGLWEPLATAALNERPERASALGLAQVLRSGFLDGTARGGLGLSATGLSDLYADPSLAYLRSRGGEVRLKTPVMRILETGERCSGVLLSGGVRVETGAVIACVPPVDLLQVLPPALAETPFFGGASRLTDSAIVSAYLWFGAKVPLGVSFAALLGGFWHWVFDRGRSDSHHVLTFVRSAANDILGESKETLVRAALADLERFFPRAARLTPRHTLVVKERGATVSLPPGSAPLRPGSRTPLARLFLAGDWTSTGLPATIEGAVASGHAAATMAISGGA